MNPKIIVHNSISLDGSYLNFDVDMGLHYQIASSFEADAHLVGSVTARTGLEAYGDASTKEFAADFEKPKGRDNLPYWVIPDSKGMLQGLLHNFRQHDFCRDVIVLVSQKTPDAYLAYLKDRDYDFHVTGDEHVDFKKAFGLLGDKYEIRTLLTDAGSTLVDVLLDAGLVDEISLLVHPVLTGNKGKPLFAPLEQTKNLKLDKHEIMNNDYLWLVYRLESA